jgi:hypothetical protein
MYDFNQTNESAYLLGGKISLGDSVEEDIA